MLFVVMGFRFLSGDKFCTELHREETVIYRSYHKKVAAQLSKSNTNLI